MPKVDKKLLGEEGFAYDGLTEPDGTVVEYISPNTKQLSDMLFEDAQAHAIDLGLTLPIRRNQFDIEGAKGGVKPAKFAREILLGPAAEGGMTTPMDLVIAQMTTGIAFGKACFEKVIEPDGSKVRYKKVAFRPAQTCRLRLDKHGSFDGFVQEGTKNGRMFGPHHFSPGKSFVYLHGGHLDPGEGRSSYIAAYNRYQHKKKVEALLWQHLMRVVGIKKAKYDGPEGASGARSLWERLKNVRSMGTIGLGPGEEAEIMATDNASAEFRETLMYLNSEMARSVLCQFLMLGTESNVGSWALSKDHSDFFLQALEAIMREMESAINNHLIAPLITMNFGENAKMPRFRFESMAQSTRELAHKTWEQFITAGMHGLLPSFGKALDEKARQAMDIPQEAVEIPEDDPTPPEQMLPDPNAPLGQVPPNGIAPVGQGAPTQTAPLVIK